MIRHFSNVFMSTYTAGLIPFQAKMYRNIVTHKATIDMMHPIVLIKFRANSCLLDWKTQSSYYKYFCMSSEECWKRHVLKKYVLWQWVTRFSSRFSINSVAKASELLEKLLEKRLLEKSMLSLYGLSSKVTFSLPLKQVTVDIWMDK